VLRPLVSVWFQVLFTQLVAVLFIVQSPYLFTIGHRGVFSLGRWAGQLHTEFHELRATLVRLSQGTFSFRVRDFHLLWCDFPDASARIGFVTPRGARNPGTNPGLGCSAFARRYSRNTCLSLFLQVLRCFSSLGSLPTAMNSPPNDRVFTPDGFPHSEISGSMLGCQLPGAYRRLPRLSSPLDAKTSTIHP
jgi:hypothetical protein